MPSRRRRRLSLHLPSLHYCGQNGRQGVWHFPHSAMPLLQPRRGLTTPGPIIKEAADDRDAEKLMKYIIRQGGKQPAGERRSLPRTVQANLFAQSAFPRFSLVLCCVDECDGHIFTGTSQSISIPATRAACRVPGGDGISILVAISRRLSHHKPDAAQAHPPRIRPYATFTCQTLLSLLLSLLRRRGEAMPHCYRRSRYVITLVGPKHALRSSRGN